MYEAKPSLFAKHNCLAPSRIKMQRQCYSLQAVLFCEYLMRGIPNKNGAKVGDLFIKFVICLSHIIEQVYCLNLLTDSQPLHFKRTLKPKYLLQQFLCTYRLTKTSGRRLLSDQDKFLLNRSGNYLGIFLFAVELKS